MLNFRCSIKDTVDIQKIQKLADEASVEILVGFPSGRQHVPTVHKNSNKEYRTYDQQDIRQAEPIDNDELAKMLSYGTADIPARPFLEEGIASKKEELRKEMEKQAEKAINGQNADWSKVGTMAVGAIYEFVRSDHYRSTKPNSQKTIKYKGSDLPLIDGGDLVNNVTFLVNGVEKQ